MLIISTICTNYKNRIAQKAYSAKGLKQQISIQGRNFALILLRKNGWSIVGVKTGNFRALRGVSGLHDTIAKMAALKIKNRFILFKFL